MDLSIYFFTYSSIIKSIVLIVIITIISVDNLISVYSVNLITRFNAFNNCFGMSYMLILNVKLLDRSN